MNQEKYVDFSSRDPANGVDPLFHQRWSPRVFDATPIPQSDLHSIFDAARWSPSCFNDQPWQFITSTPASYERFLNLLIEFNQSWAKSAPVLGFIVTNRLFDKDGKPNGHGRFDTGAAWMAMTLQANQLGYHTHGMGGINYEGVYTAFDLDKDKIDVICGFALGKLARLEQVDEDKRKEAFSASGRKPLQQIWREI